MADSPPARGKKGRGRDTKLTPQVQESICRDIADGLDQKHSALRAGVTPRSVQNWLRWGREAADEPGEGDAPYVSFLSAYQKAVADAVAANVLLIQIAAREGTWQAAAWWLERRHPDQYSSDRKRVKELERLLAEIIKGGGGAGDPHPAGGAVPKGRAAVGR